MDLVYFVCVNGTQGPAAPPAMREAYRADDDGDETIEMKELSEDETKTWKTIIDKEMVELSYKFNEVNRCPQLRENK